MISTPLSSRSRSRNLSSLCTALAHATKCLLYTERISTNRVIDAPQLIWEGLLQRLQSLDDGAHRLACLFRPRIPAEAEGRRVELRGFGAFSTRAREARVGRNPRTGDQVDVEAKRVPHFKAGKELRERLNADG